mgnify:CR=1 FL=1
MTYEIRSLEHERTLSTHVCLENVVTNAGVLAGQRAWAGHCVAVWQAARSECGVSGMWCKQNTEY